MADKVRAIPEGYGTVTPYIVVNDARKALDFYKNALGAEEVFAMPDAGGKKIMHAEMRIGNSMVMLADESPEMGHKSPKTLGGSAGSLHLYVDDVDAAFQRASTAGMKVQMPPTDMFWGDRYAKLEDPFGHCWGFATHKEDVPMEEMGKRMAQTMGGKK